MQIKIENYRGIKSAEFDLSAITLVAAPNAKGKSAIAQAVGAVLSGTPVPIQGIPKTQAGLLVHGGQATGFAQLTHQGGVTRVDWPRAAYKTRGDAPPHVSQIAAGIELLTPPASAVDTAEQQKRRAELLIEILQAKPTIEDLRKRLASEGIEEAVADNVWQTIEKQGWEGAHAQAKETGARLKGQWREVTGMNFGTKIAQNYIPSNWEPELAAASAETLESALADARESLESMIAVTAIDDAERERLEVLASELKDRQQALNNAAAEVAAKTSAGKNAAEVLAKMRDPNAQTIHDCVHCGGKLSFIDGKLTKGQEPSADEVEAWNNANSNVANLRVQARSLNEVAAAAGRAVTEAINAKCKLEAISNGSHSDDQVEAARRGVTECESRLLAFKQKTKADRLLASVNQNASIVSALDTGGIRQDKLNDRLQTFIKDEVNVRADIAGFQHIEIQSDMAITYGGRPWSVLSESERFRVRALLQVSVSNYDESCAVVIDAADILDAGGRNGLIRLLRNFGIPAIICMTINERGQVPDLKKAGIGTSYWINEGELVAAYGTAEKQA